jgi:hypothetical protein
VPEEFEDHAKLMTDLMVLSFQADMTRVVSFMLAREGSNRPYRNIGVSDGHHSVTHHQNDPAKIEKVAKINLFHVQTFAYMLQKLRETKDGDGTLLDHSQILYGSSISDGNAHTHHDLPLLLAGGAAGRMSGGRHIRYPKETPMNNLLMTMLDQAGVHVDKLGDATGEVPSLATL